MSSVINCAAYSNGRRLPEVKIDEIQKLLKQPDKFVWIGLHEPDEELMVKAQQEFGLHDLAIEDAHRAHQRPKIETYGDTLFIVLRTVEVIDDKISFGETHFFVGKNFLITIRHGSSLTYGLVRSRCETSPDLMIQGPSFPLYAVMDSIVDQYFPVVTQLDEDLERLESDVFEGEASLETITRIYQLKRELLQVKRAVSPLIDICNRLFRIDVSLIPEVSRPYFRDIYDHAIRINEMVDNTRELLSSVLDVNFSIISMAQNDVSKKFAGWAALLAVPTMIAGIYGMNFQFIPELKWKYGYPFVLALTLAICSVLYWRFKRSGWL